MNENGRCIVSEFYNNTNCIAIGNTVVLNLDFSAGATGTGLVIGTIPTEYVPKDMTFGTFYVAADHSVSGFYVNATGNIYAWALTTGTRYRGQAVWVRK